MKLKIALLAILSSTGILGYLSFEHYTLMFGVGEASATCSLSEAFDCFAVTASQYSSFLGLPMAVWGLSTYAILLLLSLIWALGWSERLAAVKNYTLLLSGFTLITSVVMAGISSLLIGSFCLYCSTIYALSLVAFLCFFSAWKADDNREPILQSIKGLHSELRTYGITFLAILPMAWLINTSLVNHFGAGKLGQIVKNELQNWKLAQKVDFALEPSLTKGNLTSSVMEITEFADFLCGHCKYASAPISAFVKSRSDVKLNFYTFPLDGSCNDAIPHSSGLQCFLAKTNYCAGKADHGWKAHDIIFENQQTLAKTGTVAKLEETLSNLLKQRGIELETLKDCIDSEETHKTILAHAKLGVESKVQGTPTIFVNGKKLSRGQLIPVLEAVYKDLGSSQN